MLVEFAAMTIEPDPAKGVSDGGDPITWFATLHPDGSGPQLKLMLAGAGSAAPAAAARALAKNSVATAIKVVNQQRGVMCAS
jgi:hypothetical protein